MKNNQPTNCLICDKQIQYLWPDMEKTTNLNDACDIYIQGDYGSSHDLEQFEATICDECLSKAIENGKIRKTGNLEWKTSDN